MQEVEGSTPTGGTCPSDFSRSSRPGYPHPVSSELESSGIRVAVGDCSVTERRRWRPPYQTGKICMCTQNTTNTTTAPGVCGNGSVPLSHSGNVVMRIGIHTHRQQKLSHELSVQIAQLFLRKTSFNIEI